MAIDNSTIITKLQNSELYFAKLLHSNLAASQYGLVSDNINRINNIYYLIETLRNRVNTEVFDDTTSNLFKNLEREIPFDNFLENIDPDYIELHSPFELPIETATLTFNNGIIKTGTLVQLGGNLIQNTFIDLANKYINFQYTNSNPHTNFSIGSSGHNMAVGSTSIDITDGNIHLASGGPGAIVNIDTSGLNLVYNNSGLTQQILLSNNTGVGIKVKDAVNSIGLSYLTDYSDNWNTGTPRVIPDIGWIQSHTSPILNFTNGITAYDDNLWGLGGSLDRNTTITLGSYSLNLSGSTTGDYFSLGGGESGFGVTSGVNNSLLDVYSTGAVLASFNSSTGGASYIQSLDGSVNLQLGKAIDGTPTVTQLEITDTIPWTLTDRIFSIGLLYGDNYSSNWSSATPRVIPDLGYISTNFASLVSNNVFTNTENEFQHHVDFDTSISIGSGFDVSGDSYVRGTLQIIQSSPGSGNALLKMFENGLPGTWTYKTNIPDLSINYLDSVGGHTGGIIIKYNDSGTITDATGTAFLKDSAGSATYVPYNGATAQLNMGVYSVNIGSGSQVSYLSSDNLKVGNTAGSHYTQFGLDNIRFFGLTGSYTQSIYPTVGTTTADAEFYLPNKTGTQTLATLTDITSGGSSSFSSVAITGTAGAGLINLVAQSVTPTTPATSHQLIYADASGRFTLMGSNGFSASLSKTSITANHIYTFPDADGTFVLGNGTTSQYIKGDGSYGTNTISGVTLGSNLSSLSVGSSLVYTSGSDYNGSAVTTLDINLGNTNIFTVNQVFSGGLNTNNNTSSNLYSVLGGSSAPGFTNSNLLFGGVSTFNCHVFVNGNSSTTVATNGGYFGFQVGAMPSTTATSGTHAWFVESAFNKFGTITNSGSTVTNNAVAYFGINNQTQFGTISGGSSYTNGTYTSVSMTGGTGTGAIATIVVAGGVVSTVAITTAGSGYVKGDVLSAAAANIGGTGSGFTFTLNSNSYGIYNAGNYVQAGVTSGVISFNTQAAAGTYNWNWPTTAGTSGQVILSGGGSTSPITYGFTYKGSGQTTLVAGTKAITVTGVTTSSKAKVSFVSIGGTVATTWQYAAVCTSNTVTITAITTAGATNTSDTSVLNYFIYE